MMSLSSWHMDIICIFLKSKKACLLGLTDLPFIIILALLNCFFLSKTRTLNSFIIHNIALMLFDMFVMVIAMQVTGLFEIEIKNIFFIAKQYLPKGCSVTFKTLKNKIWFCRKISHPCTKMLWLTGKTFLISQLKVIWEHMITFENCNRSRKRLHHWLSIR